MALTMKQILRRHGAFVCAVTALLVAATILLQGIIQGLIGLASVGQFGPGFALVTVGYGLRTALPFAIGFFLSLWIIAPIAEELRVGHVISRAILATGIGATVLFIVLAVLAIIDAFVVEGPLFGQSFPLRSFDFGLAVQGLDRALTSTLVGFVGLLPLGVLAGVLLWQWRKGHPPRHPLPGLIDEV